MLVRCNQMGSKRKLRSQSRSQHGVIPLRPSPISAGPLQSQRPPCRTYDFLFPSPPPSACLGACLPPKLSAAHEPVPPAPGRHCHRRRWHPGPAFARVSRAGARGLCGGVAHPGECARRTTPPLSWPRATSRRKTAAQFPAKAATTRVAEGFGDTCAKFGLLIAMASILGEAMLLSGGAEAIAAALLRMTGAARAIASAPPESSIASPKSRPGVVDGIRAAACSSPWPRSSVKRCCSPAARKRSPAPNP